jgi:hypothetical protein
MGTAMQPGKLLIAVVAITAGAVAQTHPPVRLLSTAVRLSGESPFPSGCEGTQNGRIFRNAAVEPSLTVDPKERLHLVGAWQQDRWSNGGADGLIASVSLDGGSTWQQSAPPFTVCSGGESRFLRASDPWVTIAPDGTVYFIGLSLTASNIGQAMLVSRSTDGGVDWSSPAFLMQDQSADVLDDKESITADPMDARYVYAVWDRLSGVTSTNLNNFRGPTWFTRTTDGGATWEAARPIFDPGANAQTLGNQIVVLPDGTLVDVFVQVLNATAPLARDERLSIAIVRSHDKGATWSTPIVVSPIQPVGVSDVKTGVPVRTAGLIPSIAADPVSGTIYVVWEDGRFTSGLREGISLSRSQDGGLTWSTPAQINQVPAVQAFTPAVAVARNGDVGVTYYDFRKDTADPKVLLTSFWRLISADEGQSWTEAPLSEPFDLAAAPVTDGAGLFVGDYQGLAAAGEGFVALFAVSSAGVIPSEVFAAARATGGDRSHNGHTEVNRYVLRRRVEMENKRK